MERYDVMGNSWFEFITGLIPRRYNSTEYISSQNKLYIFNGNTYTGSTYTDTVEIVGITTGELTYSASNPYPVEYAGSAVWNGKIYIFGGSNSGLYSNRLYEFDPTTFEWTRLPDMPEAKQTSGRIVDGKIYVFGGYNGTVSTRIDVYDIQKGTWTLLGHMPIGISAHATTVSGKYIWLVGAYNNLQSIAIFNIETSVFSQLTSNMTGRRHAGAIAVDNNLYTFGGNQTSSSISALNSLEYADISNYMVSIADMIFEPPKAFQLYQNFPNPFNSTTKIMYSIQETGFISLKIYDLHGKEIDVLVQDFQNANSYSLNYNASNLSSGVYFYSLRINNKILETKKMILMR